MVHLLHLLPGLLALAAVLMLVLNASEPVDAQALVKKIQGVIAGTIPADADPGKPRGEFLNFEISDSLIYPGTENPIRVYVPPGYDPARPACVLIKLDGIGDHEAAVLDSLIEAKQIPMMIGVGITPGTLFKDPPGTHNRRVLRFNRSYEFDSTNDQFADFVLNEVLTGVAQQSTRSGHPINLSSDGNDRAATGASTGGIGSFTLAWQRPDQFSRVYSLIGTFVSMRGGHDYPALIRKTEPKAIRLFLEDGSTDAWNPLFGSWYEANLSMESALTFAGYDVAHAWGTHGHDGGPGSKIFADVMRWLWRDYPATIKPAISQNSTLREIIRPEQGWQKLPFAFKSAAGLVCDQKGTLYVSDTVDHQIFRIDSDGSRTSFAQNLKDVTGLTLGKDAILYATQPGMQKIVRIDTNGKADLLIDSVTCHSLTLSKNGILLASLPGEHPDLQSRLVQIKSDGQMIVLNQSFYYSTGIAFSPDGALFCVCDSQSQWIYSYVVQEDGALSNKQRFFWLHNTDIPNNSGAEDLAYDQHGNLYVATRMGVQVCDQNGRVRAILPMPAPCLPAGRLCFGGPNLDVLYVTDGKSIFKRQLKIAGIAPWSDAMIPQSQGAG